MEVMLLQIVSEPTLACGLCVRHMALYVAPALDVRTWAGHKDGGEREGKEERWVMTCGPYNCYILIYSLRHKKTNLEGNVTQHIH